MSNIEAWSKVTPWGENVLYGHIQAYVLVI